MVSFVCLPKKVAGTHPTLGDYFTPENTRPLSIVNTDNRILAAATKYALHDYLEKWVSIYQKGFLNGRSMNDNIILLDYGSKM